MDNKEEKLLVLSRLGRETIIKNGTYDIEKPREITPDDPEKGRSTIRSTLMKYEENPKPSEEPISEDEASDLASQIIASNFKSGMSQAEVDAFMSTLM